MLIINDAQATGLYTSAHRDVLSHVVIKHWHIRINIAPVPVMDRYTMGDRFEHHTVGHVQDGREDSFKQIYDMFVNVIEFEEFE